MSSLSAVSLTLAACLGAAAPGEAPAAPQLVLSDPAYPLWEIRPLDRRVYVLTLQGNWKAPPDRDGDYYVNLDFPDGGAVMHRVADNRHFRRGDVECLLIQYQYERHHFQPGDRLGVTVTRQLPGGGSDDQEVISNRLEVAWPFDRKVVRLAPRTRFTPPEPIDTFHPAGEEPLAPPKPISPLPPPAPPAEEPAKPPPEK